MVCMRCTDSASKKSSVLTLTDATLRVQALHLTCIWLHKRWSTLSVAHGSRTGPLPARRPLLATAALPDAFPRPDLLNEATSQVLLEQVVFETCIVLRILG